MAFFVYFHPLQDEVMAYGGAPFTVSGELPTNRFHAKRHRQWLTFVEEYSG